MDTINRIIVLLKEQNKTQKELTDYLGLDKSTFTQWKKGASLSYTKYYSEIAVFLGVPVSVLVDDSIATKVDNILNSIGEKDEEDNIVIDYKKIAPAEVPTRAEARLKYKDLTEEDYRLLDMFAEFLISRHEKSGAGGSEQA